MKCVWEKCLPFPPVLCSVGGLNVACKFGKKKLPFTIFEQYTKKGLGYNGNLNLCYGCCCIAFREI